MRFALKQESALRLHVRRPGVMGARCFTKRNEINGVGRDGAHVQYYSPWPVRFPSPDREVDASPHSIGKRRVGSLERPGCVTHVAASRNAHLRRLPCKPQCFGIGRCRARLHRIPQAHRCGFEHNAVGREIGEKCCADALLMRHFRKGELGIHK
jgi:hypothetical protein